MKLYRPHVPLESRCRVALRQLGEMWPDDVIEANRRDPKRSSIKAIVPHAFAPSHGRLLEDLLRRLADLLNCATEDLRLDHDPPLGARPQFRRGLGKKTYYEPDANDPAHLLYRPHGSQFAGSHDVKTRIRGDHGQYSDVVLIKRERRRQKRSSGEGKRSLARILAERAKKKRDRAAQLKRKSGAKRQPKTKWPSRPLRSANRWPKHRTEGKGA